MFEYIYTKENTQTIQLQNEIIDSDIETEISHINWNEPNTVIIFFNSELTLTEKGILDTIVSEHIANDLDNRTKVEILDEIFQSGSTEGASPTQQERFITVLNTTPIFIIAIESAVKSGLWDFAKSLIQTNTILTAEDKILMLGILPE